MSQEIPFDSDNFFFKFGLRISRSLLEYAEYGNSMLLVCELNGKENEQSILTHSCAAIALEFFAVAVVVCYS